MHPCDSPIAGHQALYHIGVSRALHMGASRCSPNTSPYTPAPRLQYPGGGLQMNVKFAWVE
eukprot:CAMPEP_0202890888 /NCGR_PEP_ID=MMETSP1392-20130828/1150_1 /ASSEMBLY_ACC=CAM_ASM_000868 /TAXON_ID=225041 /ORGANISM="Chlamydomonas chlamydogama, Strain SAG 11-48b" /LENGTH=60 /DNA_ID=CAMNT_0049574539 /DNA_START=104 /DNA_END=286 /DNA_ORIENTATION=-